MTTEPPRALLPALPVWRSILFVPALAERFVDSALRQPAPQNKMYSFASSPKMGL